MWLSESSFLNKEVQDSSNSTYISNAVPVRPSTSIQEFVQLLVTSTHLSVGYIQWLVSDRKAEMMVCHFQN